MAMGEFEEETYSTVFKVLRHPVRRRLLRTLSQGPRSFTDLQGSFKVNSAVLTFHLDSMKDLVCKTEDGKYILSTMGEGAMALMERVEEPPKVASTKPSHKNSRRLSILQSAAICIAVVLLVSGTYLTSISLVQEFYDVPADWSLTNVFYEYAEYDLVSGVWTSLPDFYDINGNSYDVRYSLLVDPSSQLLNQLTKEHEADIYVNLRTNETAPSALYFVDLYYLQRSPRDFNYHLKKQTYQGEFQPAKNPIGLAFSTHINLPFNFYTSNFTGRSMNIEDKNPTLLKSIWVNIWTNTTYNEGNAVTDEIMADFINIKAAATEEFHSETRPYESQGSLITTVGIILVAAALMMHILSLLKKQI
jgi:DNA-binding transcriptional ArsR family regulator